MQHGMSNVRVRADVGAVKVSVPAFLPKKTISKLASSNSNIRKSYLHNLGIDGGYVCACMWRNLLRILVTLRTMRLIFSMFFFVSHVLSLLARRENQTRTGGQKGKYTNESPSAVVALKGKVCSTSNPNPNTNRCVHTSGFVSVT